MHFGEGCLIIWVQGTNSRSVQLKAWGVRIWRYSADVGQRPPESWSWHLGSHLGWKELFFLFLSLVCIVFHFSVLAQLCHYSAPLCRMVSSVILPHSWCELLAKAPFVDLLFLQLIIWERKKRDWQRERSKRQRQKEWKRLSIGQPVYSLSLSQLCPPHSTSTCLSLVQWPLAWARIGGHKELGLFLSGAEDKMSSETCLIQRKSSLESNRRRLGVKSGTQVSSWRKSMGWRKKIEEYFGGSKIQEQRHKDRNMYVDHINYMNY